MTDTDIDKEIDIDTKIQSFIYSFTQNVARVRAVVLRLGEGVSNLPFSNLGPTAHDWALSTEKLYPEVEAAIFRRNRSQAILFQCSGVQGYHSTKEKSAFCISVLICTVGISWTPEKTVPFFDTQRMYEQSHIVAQFQRVPFTVKCI